MNLPRHATLYLLFVAVLSLFQLAIGASMFVLVAIDLVCLCALYPLTRAKFGPNDLLFLSFCLYYGTFSLVLKSVVLQPVQMNLVVPTLTCTYLVIGFGLIFLSYLFVERVMTKHYPGTKLRRWNWFERAYADQQFLSRFTTPFSLFSIAFVVGLSIFSHSVQEVDSGRAASSGLATFGLLAPVIQLALAMQLSLAHRTGDKTARALTIATIVVAFGLSIFNNQKLIAFMVIVTYALDAVAYRVRINPRIVAIGLVVVAISFLYISPLIHIVRGLQAEKSERVSLTLHVLTEAHFNPVELQKIERSMTDATGENTLENQIDYLAPYNFSTDRFTLLMPIDQMARADLRAPIGLDESLKQLVGEALPKYFVGEHTLEVLSDRIAWRFSIRANGSIARPTLGLFGSGYGIAGGWGLLILGPLATLIVFTFVKFSCNGSIWQNPWAIFIASSLFFYGEADIAIVIVMFRGLLPLLIVGASLIVLDRMLNKNMHQRPLAPTR